MVTSERGSKPEEEKDDKQVTYTTKPASNKRGNLNVRGGGGMCPVKGHSKLLGNLDVADLAGLGKASEGKKRELLTIPDGYRLENTGIRVELLRTGANFGADGKPVRQFRGVVYATAAGAPTKRLRTVELSKRNEPSWNGLHLHVGEDEMLVVEVQERRTNGDGTWTDSFSPVTVEPLRAFTVQDQDIAWLKTPTDPSFSGSDLVWAELSLQKKSSNIREKAKGTTVASKKRKKIDVKFEPRKRDADEVAADEAMLAELLNEADPTTLQDIVYMKDIWNKCLGWINMTGEHFVEGLFLRCPDLLAIFGDIPAELAVDMFVSLIDKAVRNLDKRTEVIARESYRAVPLCPEEDVPFRTLEEGFNQFAQLGMRPRHWKEARAMFLIAIKNANPYLEENDVELLALGVDSCAYKFWNHHMMKPALIAIKAMDDIFESEENRQALKKSFEPLAADKVRSGMLFYQELFKSRPDVIPYFGRTDMDFLAGHLFDAIELLINVVDDFERALPVLRHLGKIHDNHMIPVFTYDAIGLVLDQTLRSVLPDYGDGTPEGDHLVRIWSALLNRTVLVTTRISFVSERLVRRAFEWVDQVAHELKWDEAYLAKRHLDIETEIRMRGMYTHTEEEVVHGARVAWRNSAKCVGRIAWNTLMVRDRRHVTNLDHMFAECLEHQRLATADGSLKAVMTVFRPRQPGTRMGMRFWNLQLVRFACYETDDGTLMGDGANKAYTDECISFGWKPPVPRTEFDVLPIVLEDSIAGTTKMFELPKEYHKVTMISHPKFPDFAKLGLRWCVVPTVTCFTLKLGGLEYPCCPFNGWFMECEITRDLLEPGRMDKMEAIAKAIGVDPTDEDDFWRERVAIETNKAVMFSFRKDGHSIVDHVTAQGQFLAHDMREKREGRECPAQWSWVVPSSGGSTMPIWHHEMRDFYIEPQYDYQAEIYAVRKESTVVEEELLARDDDGDAFEKILIVFASVTGTAEGYAYRAKKLLRPLQVTVANCETTNPKEIWSQCVVGGGAYSAVLFITSTFGEGLPPPTAVNFFKTLQSLPITALADVPFAVMAIGSSIYPDFCQAGIDLDRALGMTGGKQIIPLTKGDEVNGQEDVVLQWISTVGSVFDLEQKKAQVASGDAPALAEVAPVSVEILSVDNEKVRAALDEEKKLAKSVSVAGDASSAGAAARFLPNGFKLCAVTMNDELVKFPTEESKAMFRSTRYLEFDLQGVSKDESSPDLVYETGDHARILPVNSTSVALAMCRCLRLDPEQWVDVNIEDGPALSTSTMRVGDLMALEIDLATQQEDGNLPLLKRLVEVASLSDDDSEESKVELATLEGMVERLTDSGDLAMLETHKAKKEAKDSEDSETGAIDEIGGIGGMGVNEAVREVTKSMQSSTLTSPHQSTRRRSSLLSLPHQSTRRRSSLLLLDSESKPKGTEVAAPSESLVREEGKKRAIATITEHHVTVPELLEQFPVTTSKLSLADCIETLPRLKPRHYSIASASEMDPSKLQLSVGKLTVTHKSTGKSRQGVCSHFLARSTVVGSSATSDAAGDAVFSARSTSFIRLGLSRSTFRLPESYKKPVIMIGPGTGIAPMLGFLQAREKAKADGEVLGPCMVFFGCRAENDFLHADRMRQWAETGVITDLQVAFSRLPGRPKEYVQHVVGRRRDAVWSMLSDPDCHYYICGDSQMAEDVFDELKSTAKLAGGLDHLDTVEFFRKMKKEHRFQADTWGVVAKRDVNLKKMVEKKYNQGEAWLKNFEQEEKKEEG